MALDKLVDSTQLDADLTSVANAIRTKGGTSASLAFPSGFVSAIGDISGGGSTLGTKTITANDTYDASDDDLDGYSQVTVNVPTGTARTSSDLEASGATVTAPAGLYASAASKSVASGSAATPATTITANPTISVDSSTGVITATASATQSVTPTVSAGYVSSGTAGTITVIGSNTESLSAQAAQTIHPSTSDQTIASGKYLTGAQTVKAVTMTNLTAGNIKKDVVVKVGDSTDDDCVTSVTGTYEGGGDTVYYGEEGFPYLKDLVFPTEKVNTNVFGCEYLETISAPNATSYGGNAGGYSCKNLRSVSFPKCTSFGNYFIRQQGNQYDALESVTIGSIGYPVTTLGGTNWRYGSHAMELTVTIYVNAATLADVPANVSNYAVGSNVYAPAGSTVTVVYRNSTTGDVITS